MVMSFQLVLVLIGRKEGRKDGKRTKGLLSDGTKDTRSRSTNGEDRVTWIPSTQNRIRFGKMG